MGTKKRTKKKVEIDLDSTKNIVEEAPIEQTGPEPAPVVKAKPPGLNNAEANANRRQRHNR